MGSNMKVLLGQTVVISGGSRGIGKAIAVRCAQEGANVAILAKTTAPHPRLPGTIYTALNDIARASGEADRAMAVPCDIRFPEQIEAAVAKIADRFGSIDVLINNASAIQLTPTAETEARRWDLMQAVGARGTFLLTRSCLGFMRGQRRPRIVNISPPLDMQPKWFAKHVAYTIAKYGMSMCVLGWAEEFRELGIAVNALWPRTLIDTAALNMIPSSQGTTPLGRRGRSVDIMADACLLLLQKPPAFTGNFCIDEALLRESGETDFAKYAVDPKEELIDDLFIDGLSMPRSSHLPSKI